MTTEELKTTISKAITQTDIEHVLMCIEVYCQSQKDSHLRQGDYKTARNWDILDGSIFNVRKQAMTMEL